MDIDAAQLPALCDTAIRDLAEVKTIGECLEIRDLAEALHTYSTKHKLAIDVQDNCRTIVVMAERRIGQELIAAQQRGDLATQERHPGSVPDGDTAPVTHADIGITRKQAAEYRQMAELTDDDIVEAKQEARARQKPVAKADFKRKAQRRQPVMEQRPDHLNALSLWLRNGPRVVRQFMDHREALSLAARWGVSLDHDEIVELMEFLAALSAGLKADRAA